MFGVSFVNSDGRTVITRDVAEQHCLEDYGGRFIPTLQDFLQEMNYVPWMHGHGLPTSAQKVIEARMEGTKKALAD